MYVKSISIKYHIVFVCHQINPVFFHYESLEIRKLGFPGGPVAKNLPANAGDMGSIPGLGTKIPHVAGQLNPCAITTEPVHCNS